MEDLLGLDFDALESAGTSTGSGSRVSYPLIVDQYHVEGADPSQHYFVGRRVDPLADPEERIKVYLDPTDPGASNPDPSRRRPDIAAFAWQQYVDALGINDSTTIQSLSSDSRMMTFTAVGGMILATDVQETEKGLSARWLYTLRQGAKDQKHNAAIGMATARRRGNGVDVETLRVEHTVLTSNIGELKAAMLQAYQPDRVMGTLAVYLRILQFDASGQVIKVVVPGQASPTAGRFELRDKRVGDRWIPRTAEEGVSEFLASPVGKHLSKDGGWAGAKIEVIPLSVYRFGSRTLERQRDVDGVYLIPPAEDAATREPLQGYALSTVRLSAVMEEGTGTVLYRLATLARPVTGELFRLLDIATPHYAPDVLPAFAAFGTAKPAADPSAPLPDDFRF